MQDQKPRLCFADVLTQKQVSLSHVLSEALNVMAVLCCEGYSIQSYVPTNREDVITNFFYLANFTPSLVRKTRRVNSLHAITSPFCLDGMQVRDEVGDLLADAEANLIHSFTPDATYNALCNLLVFVCTHGTAKQRWVAKLLLQGATKYFKPLRHDFAAFLRETYGAWLLDTMTLTSIPEDPLYHASGGAGVGGSNGMVGRVPAHEQQRDAVALSPAPFTTPKTRRASDLDDEDPQTHPPSKKPKLHALDQPHTVQYYEAPFRMFQPCHGKPQLTMPDTHTCNGSPHHVNLHSEFAVRFKKFAGLLKMDMRHIDTPRKKIRLESAKARVRASYEALQRVCLRCVMHVIVREQVTLANDHDSLETLNACLTGKFVYKFHGTCGCPPANIPVAQYVKPEPESPPSTPQAAQPKPQPPQQQLPRPTLPPLHIVDAPRTTDLNVHSHVALGTPSFDPMADIFAMVHPRKRLEDSASEPRGGPVCPPHLPVFSGYSWSGSSTTASSRSTSPSVQSSWFDWGRNDTPLPHSAQLDRRSTSQYNDATLQSMLLNFGSITPHLTENMPVFNPSPAHTGRS